MTHELCKQTLLGGEVVRLLNTRIASSNHRLHTIVVNKKSLSGYDDKRFIMNGQVSMLPYGHRSIREDMFFKSIMSEPHWGADDLGESEQESGQQAQESRQHAQESGQQAQESGQHAQDSSQQVKNKNQQKNKRQTQLVFGCGWCRCVARVCVFCCLCACVVVCKTFTSSFHPMGPEFQFLKNVFPTTFFTHKTCFTLVKAKKIDKIFLDLNFQKILQVIAPLWDQNFIFRKMCFRQLFSLTQHVSQHFTSIKAKK